MAAKLPAFVVDKKGLAQLLERKGKAFAVIELIQNAWDEDTSQVDVTLEHREGDLYRLKVEDDNPEGFKDLAHAYTLFAESLKKGDASKRGRFNLGEKLVIAICEKASVITTKGTILFDGDSRQHLAKKRAAGSEFSGLLRMTDDEAQEVGRVVHTLIPPHGITTTFNMHDVITRLPLRTFEVTLRTELADDDGRLKPTTRKCEVEIYDPLPGETASIYELGIPVVETGDRFHVNVGQKVPLPTDRDNVPPGYLRDVRVAVLNACHDILTDADAKAAWVTNAMEDEKATGEAVQAVFEGKFGDKTVIFDPNDPEANKRAVEEGYTVVPGGSLPKAAWKHVKDHGIASPAGQIMPTLKLPGGTDLKLMNPDHYPGYVRNFEAFVKAAAMQLMGVEITTFQIAQDATLPIRAAYSRDSKSTATITFNLGRLGHKWFEQIGREQLSLILHEFAHHYASDHLDASYYRALETLAGRAVLLALEQPDLFAAHGIATAAA